MVGLSTIIFAWIFSSCVTSWRTCLTLTIRADVYDGSATQACQQELLLAASLNPQLYGVELSVFGPRC